MTNPELKVADAIRHATAAIQAAIEDGSRSRAIDADDLVEVLLSIADRLDPPFGQLVDLANACPKCGERDIDWLAVQPDQSVRCGGCGTTYRPGE